MCPAACRRTYTTYHPEIWHGLLISPGLGTKPGGNPKCRPPAPPHPRPCPWLRSLLLFSSLDHSARDYFTIVLWNSPGQCRVAHTCKYIGISTPMQQSVCVWTFDQYQSPIEDEISSLWMRKNGCHFLSICRVVNSQSTALYSRSLQVRCLVHFFKDHRNVFVY